jgi:glycosyltransferase involved in cell wall biosynthesis
MKILVCTQKVDKNDAILGFFHGWIEEFSKHCESVLVICLEKGEYNLSSNVKVLSLGKENGDSRIKYILRFYKYIWKYRKDYDNIFVHMNPEYIMLGGMYWRICKKKIGLWYMHKSITLKLRIAEKLVQKIFTGTKASFRLKSNKVVITGHGIDLKSFSFKSQILQKETKKFITVSRISRIKRIEDVIELAYILKKRNKIFDFKIIGDILDIEYFKELQHKVDRYDLNNYIKFVGKVPSYYVKNYLSKADIFIHTGNTGSLDKTVLEAMASGLLVYTANDSSMEMFYENGLDNFVYKEGNIDGLSEKVLSIFDFRKSYLDKVLDKMRKIVMENHDLEKLISRIVQDEL